MTAPSLFAREDTMLGVCEGLGQETGIPANLFRIALALGLFWNPVAVVAAYLTLGVILALFRWAVPFPAAIEPQAAPAPLLATANDDEAPSERIAA